MNSWKLFSWFTVVVLPAIYPAITQIWWLYPVGIVAHAAANFAGYCLHAAPIVAKEISQD